MLNTFNEELLKQIFKLFKNFVHKVEVTFGTYF